jgi:hypothetical protein
MKMIRHQTVRKNLYASLLFLLLQTINNLIIQRFIAKYLLPGFCADRDEISKGFRIIKAL